MARIATLLFVALCSAAALAAGMGLEIITLQHKQSSEVLPTIRPFLADGATASGMNEKLFLKTTPANAAEIRRLLASIDREAKRLIVRVSQNRDAVSTGRGAELSGDVALGKNVRIIQPPSGRGGGQVEIRRGDSVIAGRVLDSRSASTGSGSQSVQVVEGGRAFIQISTSVPIPLRQVIVGPQGTVVTDSVVYRDIGNGFYVEPHVAGERVTLEISQNADSPGGHGPGSATVQRLATTVSGRLGEWIALGGIDQDSSSERRGTSSLSTRDLRERRGIWLIVEEAP
jgi:type II secretory pathway component GspD/PulD (secretin)